MCPSHPDDDPAHGKLRNQTIAAFNLYAHGLSNPGVHSRRFDNHPINDCRELTSDTVFDNCQYSSHGGNPWQAAAWSFTRGNLNNGYSGNANRRVILGPTFAPGTNSCTWHIFGAETNARNIANTWRATQNVGDMFLR